MTRWRRTEHSGFERGSATHPVTGGYPKLIPDECVNLQKINSLDKDTLGNLLSKLISLYGIKYCNGILVRQDK